MVAPITIASAQAVCIDCCSNIIAQTFTCYQNREPWHLDPIQLLRFALFACLTAPINFLWQNLLERLFPKWDYERRSSKDRSSEDGRTEDIALEERGQNLDGRDIDGREKLLGNSEEGVISGGVEDEGNYTRRRNKRNIFFKWFTDCITMGAILNTTAFLVIMGFLKGKTVVEVGASFRTEFFEIITNSYKIWPFASVINFTFVPVEKRIVFLSFCGLLWNIYLSFVAARV